ncbi:HEPN domain-containing protein [Vibrio fluvialis]|nr:hypothetical protein [Vibrio fluvialis]
MSQDGSRLVINNMFREFEENYQYLMENQQVSFATDYKAQFSKVLLLSVASYFESRVTEQLKSILFADQCSMVKSFLENKALSRQYHTLFNWKQGAGGANQFFGFLGKGFGQFMDRKKDEQPELKQSIANFMELGYARNLMVHENYATFKLEMTSDDIKSKFESAILFADNLEKFAKEFRELQAVA